MIKVLQTDITSLDVDVIVNAANEQLARGSGVCGAIHKAAGPELATECSTLRPCSVGGAVITRGYLLKAPFVIHAVGPIYHSKSLDVESLLESAYLQSLKLALLNNCKSIAFPCISTGVFGFPKNEAASIAIRTVKTFLETNSIEVNFCCFEDEDYEIYKSKIENN